MKLKDVLPYRGGNSRAGERESKFPKLKWTSEDLRLRIATLTHPFAMQRSDALPTFTVECRRFIKGWNDVLTEAYEATDGSVVELKSPPIACVCA